MKITLRLSITYRFPSIFLNPVEEPHLSRCRYLLLSTFMLVNRLNAPATEPLIPSEQRLPSKFCPYLYFSTGLMLIAPLRWLFSQCQGIFYLETVSNDLTKYKPVASPLDLLVCRPFLTIRRAEILPDIRIFWLTFSYLASTIE